MVHRVSIGKVQVCHEKKVQGCQEEVQRGIDKIGARNAMRKSTRLPRDVQKGVDRKCARMP